MATIQNIWRYYQQYKWVAIFSIATSSMFEIIDLVVPYAIGQILNVLSNQPLDGFSTGAIATIVNLTHLPPNRLTSLGVLLGLIVLATVGKAPIQPWLSTWFHWDIALRTRRDAFHQVVKKILTLPLEFYDEHNPGRIGGRISRGLENHTWSYPEIAGQMIPKLCRVFGIFVIIWLIQWQIAFAFCISFIVILGLTWKNLSKLIEREEVLDKYYENTESRTSEIITNIKTVKAFATEQAELIRQQRRINRHFQVLDRRLLKGYLNLDTWQRTTIQICVFSILVATLMATVRGEISLGHFVTTLTLSSMAYAELEPISHLAEIFARRFASMIRFHEFMQEKEGVDAKIVDRPSPVVPVKFTGKIELVNLTFGYQPERQVLQDINLLIEPYQTIALVGRSGSGKSTLVKLLFRYFEPSQGKILIDGTDIRNLDVTAYRRRLAIVHQEVDVFNGTLLDNLTYGNREASFSQVESACAIARVDEFIEQLPQGYYTVVGERGMRLSGGQRQRLGIARALLVEPDVLIFDEATSSLDYESERSIQLAMRSILGTRTTIVIAHRLSTVREADKIVVLDRGQIVEVGSHEELLQNKGIYHRLHALQETGELVS
ncbi:ABC transporter ATP-binding protein [Merismopedia glauca CCAP 1448/3]|uniref:ABC transporter ATP-binding protein n=2 Tax=Merismopedia TaxID=53402 RepID=A0A2T1C0F3_9CYAN|nr:ABC transporter ATP-binding protein [Merismopedia glauca]PSB01722.1 ABC transporter ATP-binding protein [Merismopedia glauca CCAP 1448/3]